MRLTTASERMMLLAGLLLSAVLVSQANLISPAFGNKAVFPDVQELAAQPSPRSTIATDLSFHSQGSQYWKSGGKVQEQRDTVLLTADGSPAYAIYRLGPFLPGDQLTSAAVIASQVGEADFAYKIAVADFSAMEWRESHEILTQGNRDVPIPDTLNLLSPSGTVYFAIIIEGFSAIHLHSLDWQFELVTAEPAVVRADLLEYEAVDQPLAIPLTALDANNRVIYGLNASARLQAAGPDSTIFADVDFKDGRARPTVTFADPGQYDVKLESAARGLNADLGTLKIYQTKLPVYSLYLEQKQLDKLEQNPRSNDYVEGSVVLAGTPLSDAKLRFRGLSTRCLDKKSWKVKLNSDHKYADTEWGYARKVLNLISINRDPSMMREKLSYDLMADLGVPAPRARFVHLRLNDVYQGVYLDVENPRNDWLAEMGIEPGGPLYKAKIQAGTQVLENLEDYQMQFEKQSREDEPYTDLACFLEELDSLESAGEEDKVSNLLDLVDLEEYTRFLAGLRLVSAFDNWRQNYYFYHDDSGSGKWIVFPWDMDLTWGSCIKKTAGDTGSDTSVPAYQRLDFEATSNLLTRRFYECPSLRAKLNETITQAMDSTFSKQQLLRKVDEYYELIENDVMADWQKPASNEEYPAHVDALSQYISERTEYIEHKLAES